MTWWDDFGGLVIGIVVFIAVIGISIWIGNIIRDKTIEDLRSKIEALGYDDLYDIQVFCNRIGADLEDFIGSKGLRKQYELFRDGKSSEFIKSAEAKKKADDAESRGRAQGMATGLAVGMSVNAGR